MSNKREKKLWEAVNWLQVLLSLLVIVLLGIAYFVIAGWQAISDIWRGFLLNIIANLIPTFILFAGAYFLFRGVEELRAEKDSDELAEKVAQILASMLASTQANKINEDNMFSTQIPEVSPTGMKLSRELDVIVKPFDVKPNPQKIVVECVYRGSEPIRIKKVKYYGVNLRAKEELLSGTHTLDGSYAVFSVPSDKAEISSGGKYIVELVLVKKWKKDAIESWYGKLGYLYFDVDYNNEFVKELQKPI